MSPLRIDNFNDNGHHKVSAARIIPSMIQEGDLHRQPIHMNQQKNSPLRHKS